MTANDVAGRPAKELFRPVVPEGDNPIQIGSDDRLRYRIQQIFLELQILLRLHGLRYQHLEPMYECEICVGWDKPQVPAPDLPARWPRDTAPDPKVPGALQFCTCHESQFTSRFARSDITWRRIGQCHDSSFRDRSRPCQDTIRSEPSPATRQRCALRRSAHRDVQDRPARRAPRRSSSQAPAAPQAPRCPLH